MEERRRARAIGENLSLGGMEYHIEEVEGYGGSVIVYRAFYRDGLNFDSVHRVLIKELFPYHPRGFLYRDGKGNVCCKPEGKAFMERGRANFYLGNQANLGLLERMPERISGNLNSFEAYGTFYSVLPVHGGDNLQKLLEEGKEFQTLKEIALCMKKILSAVEAFHDNGILHLDISPDNILILSTHALLIDYNSVWPMRRKEGEFYYFSEKKGYTSPEIRLKEEENIGPAADLYSVSAVFFRMLTGEILSDEAVSGRGLLKSFRGNLKIFQGQPDSVSYKAVQIANKGLHILARKRYQTAAEMQKDFDELLLRIDGRGISHSALWEGSVREWKRQRQTAGRYLKRSLRTKDGTLFSEEECLKILSDGQAVFLEGPGGMGKTRFLMRLWESGIEGYRKSLPVTVYIPLIHYQKYREETEFIRKYLLRHLVRLKQSDSLEEAQHELNMLLENASSQNGGFLFLLDGLNEAGERKGGLLKEIEELGQREGIGVIVTDRTDLVKKYALHGFQTAKLLPLTQKEAAAELTECGIPLPDHKELLTLFENPMMLDLYQKIYRMAQENGAKVRCPGSMEEMTGYYLESLCIHELRRDSGNQTRQLLHTFLIHHLLPDIAGEMKRKKKTLFTLEELYGQARKSYRIMQGRSFAMAFPEYMGKTRLILKEIANEREWFDYAVSEQLIGRLGLLNETEKGSYRLIHDNFIPYLSGLAKENRKKINRFWLRTNRVKAGAVVLSAMVIATAGITIRRENMPRQLSKEEGGIVYSAMLRMEINMGICNTQIHGQNAILKIASREGTLLGNPEDIQALSETIEKKIGEADRAYLSYRDGDGHLDNLEELGQYLPIDEIEDLYQKPAEFKEITEEVTKRLQERLCGAGSIYNTYDKRKPLVDAYCQYVEAYAMVCGAKYSQIVYSLQQINAQQAAEELMDAASEMLAVGKYINYNSQVEVSDALTKAERYLNSAIREMERQELL